MNIIADTFEKNRYVLDRHICNFRFDHALAFNILNNPFETNNAPVFLNDNLSVYIGFPWCKQRCVFCEYTCGIESHMSNHILYQELLLKEIAMSNEKIENRNVSSLYFGGGTPTIQDNKVLFKYLDLISGNFNIDTKTLITIESDISSLNEEKIVICSQKSNRISIGVQTFNSSLRHILKRHSEKKEILKTFSVLKKHFKNINIDLIYGLCYQSIDLFIEDIRVCIQMEISSITLYKLEFYENSSLYKSFLSNPQIFPNNIETRNMYKLAKELLLSNGYIESPVGWFIRKNEQTTENHWRDRIVKWKSDNTYLGFGVKAFSNGNSFHYINEDKFSMYYNKISSGILPIRSIRFKHPIEIKILEEIKNAKVNLSIHKDILEVFKEYSDKLYSDIKELIENLIGKNYLIEREDSFLFTYDGISIIHFILGDIVQKSAKFIYENYGRNNSQLPCK